MRYRGQGLANGGKIAVISNDALGNFVVLTPLFQMLRHQLAPSEIHYYTGPRTIELQQASDLFEKSFPLSGSGGEEDGYDLVVNVERSDPAKALAAKLASGQTTVCGPCFDGHGNDLAFLGDEQGALWADKDWTAQDLVARYPILESPFIGEIFCRLCYLKGPVPRYVVPGEDSKVDIPPVLIATAASLPEKLWPTEKWIAALKEFKARGLAVGLLGAHPSQQKEFWKGEDEEAELIHTGLVADLRGTMTLPQVVGALSKASLVLTIDNGILHLAVGAGVPTIGLFRRGIHRLWAPPSQKLSILIPEESEPVASIPWQQVCDAVSHAL